MVNKAVKEVIEAQHHFSLPAILSDTTCPPCSLKEFQDYLVYKEHSAENLQFYNWVQSYERRFAGLNDREKDKSPKPPPRRNIMPPKLDGRKSSLRSNFSGLTGRTQTTESSTPWDDSSTIGAKDDIAPPLVKEVGNNNAGEISAPNTPTSLFEPEKLTLAEHYNQDPPKLDSVAPHELPPSQTTGFNSAFSAKKNGQAAELEPIREWEHKKEESISAMMAGIDPQDQPFRLEVERVIAAFFEPNAPAELNIPGPMCKHIRECAANSTNPEIFAEAKQHVYTTMQKSSFPEFSKLATANINNEKKIYWLCVGTTDFMIGVVIYLLCILLRSGRGFRVFGLPFTWFGSMQFYSATQDLCFQVYGRNSRQLYPWELVADDKSFNLSTADTDFGDLSNLSKVRQALLPRSKVFEKEKLIEDPYVKAIQRRRWIKTWVVASTVAFIVFAACMAVPNRPKSR